MVKYCALIIPAVCRKSGIDKLQTGDTISFFFGSKGAEQ
jgi:hypothetical protein